jgi:hypothetical protein
MFKTWKFNCTSDVARDRVKRSRRAGGSTDGWLDVGQRGWYMQRDLLNVHRMKYAAYRRFSRSANRQSTICGCGVSIYSASVSELI